jgi:hypothetical protein
MTISTLTICWTNIVRLMAFVETCLISSLVRLEYFESSCQRRSMVASARRLFSVSIVEIVSTSSDWRREASLAAVAMRLPIAAWA